MTLGKIVTESFESFKRNMMLSASTVISIGVIFLLLNLILTVGSVAQMTVTELEEKLQITVYLNEEITLAQTEGLIEALTSFEDVKPPVIYVSPDDAKKFIMDNFPETGSFLETYDQKLPANLTITPRSPEAVSAIHKFLQKDQFKKLLHPLSMNEQERQEKTVSKIVSRLSQIQNFIGGLVTWVIVAFLLGGMLLIGNAIHLSIHARRQEIRILKLIGTPLPHIRAPLVLEGIWYGIAGFFVNLLGLLVFQAFDETPLGSLTNMLLLEFVIVVLVSAGASALAAHVYLSKR